MEGGLLRHYVGLEAQLLQLPGCGQPYGRDLRPVEVLGGLRTDGMQFLIGLVKGEIERQEPDSRVVMLDRDFLIDNGVDFARDLVRVMDDMTSGDTRINWIVEQDVPVMDWQKALEKLKGRDTQVYLFTNACRQVPCCFRLLGNQ